MKHLIRHLIDNHLDTIVAESLMHCHVHGLHSVMLLKSPERTIRMFITSDDHHLWMNYPSEIGSKPLSLGFHPHHCNMTLHVVRGAIFNWVVSPARRGFLMDRFIWDTPIGREEFKGGFFIDQQGVIMDSVSQQRIFEGEAVHMHASDIHTVAIQRGEVTAWLVYEGREDPRYQPYAWSNADLSTFDTSGLYVKPTQDDVLALIADAGFI